ncbi:hypothetical protein YC2023_093962 [Brassica napus]
MASRWWDPGDLGVGGEFSSRVGFGLVGSKVVLILRWFGLKRDKGIRERFRNHGILGDLLAILILIKKVSQSREVSGILKQEYKLTNPMTSIKDVDSHCKSPISKGLVCVADIKFPLPYMPKSFSHMLWIISHTT